MASPSETVASAPSPLPSANDVSAAVAALQKKVVFSFNSIFSQFLREIKGKDPEIKKRIKAYRCIDKLSEAYINETGSALRAMSADLCSVAGLAHLLETAHKSDVLFKNTTLEWLVEHISAVEHPTVLNYFLTMNLFAYFYEELDGEEEADAEAVGAITSLFYKTMDALKQINKGEATPQTYSEIVDGDVLDILKRIESLQSAHRQGPTIEEETATGGANGNANGNANAIPENIDEFLENSCLGKIAKEISTKVDLSGIDMSNPQNLGDMLNFQNLMSGKGGLSSIISQVGSTITEKIQSGEIKQEQLLQEAMSIMGKLHGSGGMPAGFPMGGMGGLANMFSSMMGGGAGAGASGSSKKKSSRSSGSQKDAKTRLREKLKARKAKSGSASQPPAESDTA